jgi:hypothetical protein
MSIPRVGESEEDTAEKRQHSFWLDQQLYDSFKKVAQLLGKTSVSEALEEAMREWVKTHIDELPTQTTITMVESKQANIDLAVRLEVKMIKEKLAEEITMLEKLTTQKPGSDAIKYWKRELQKTLQKAIRIFKQTRDAELGQLLERAEKFV